MKSKEAYKGEHKVIAAEKPLRWDSITESIAACRVTDTGNSTAAY